jgi:hypothetical protein
MKNILLAAALTLTLAVNAQIANNSFETWATDTIYFPGINSVPPDTFEAQNPANWTSSNSLSGTDSLGGVFFVTQTNVAYHGTSAVNIVTDTLSLPTIPNFPLLKLTFPGFIVNGKFPINTETLLTSGDVISPLSIQGAGQPFSQKLRKIKGYYNYAPVFNPNTNANDTCVVWAALRKGNTLVGEAIFKSNTATAGYQPFEAAFKYVNCETPDTLVVFIASSVPNIQAILGGGSSGLVPGSVLKVDSVYYEDLPVNYNFAPIARNDEDTTNKNSAKTIVVKLNDEDCDNATPSLTVNLVSQPANGTAVVATGNVVTYTPNNNYFGVDTFSYTLSDGTNTSSPARVRVLVLNSSSINDVNQVAVTLYPVPASDLLNIQLNYIGKATAFVYNALGAVVKQVNLTDSTTQINLGDIANGAYGIQILNADNRIIARSKFIVAK